MRTETEKENRRKCEYVDVWSKKIRAINYLGGKCVQCGDNNIFHLTFHHIDKNNKDYEITDIRNRRWSLIKTEIKKCELLCENCHKKLHFLQDENVTDSAEKIRNDKKLYLEYKNTNCVECGYNDCNGSLTFHHKNKTDKLFNIGSLCERLVSLSDLKEHIKRELDKCDVLCFNCHVKKHINFEIFNKYKKEIYYKVDNFKELRKKVSRDAVFKLHLEGLTNKKIAKELNCARSTISDILRGRSNDDKKLKEKFKEIKKY
jgi:hypothetical protein